MSAARVLMLRHGQTDWNDAGRFQGSADIPLNAVGVEQARQVAETLAGEGVSAIVSSDLQRAAVTAQILGERLELPVISDRRVREINVGQWEGLTPEEIAATDPQHWIPITQGRDGRHSATGETATDAGRRVADAVIEHAAALGSQDTLVVVGHGLTTRVAAMLLIGLSYPDAHRFGGLGNCHWAVLRPGEPWWRLLAYNRS